MSFTYEQVTEARKRLNSFLREKQFLDAGAGITNTGHGFELVIHTSEGVPDELAIKEEFEGIPLKIIHTGKVMAF